MHDRFAARRRSRDRVNTVRVRLPRAGEHASVHLAWCNVDFRPVERHATVLAVAVPFIGEPQLSRSFSGTTLFSLSPFSGSYFPECRRRSAAPPFRVLADDARLSRRTMMEKADAM